MIKQAAKKLGPKKTEMGRKSAKTPGRETKLKTGLKTGKKTAQIKGHKSLSVTRLKSTKRTSAK